MQNDRYAGRQVGTCIWCSCEYDVAFSHARDNGHFCTKKCEIEARFWLHDQLKPPQLGDGSQPGSHPSGSNK